MTEGITNDHLRCAYPPSLSASASEDNGAAFLYQLTATGQVPSYDNESEIDEPAEGEVFYG